MGKMSLGKEYESEATMITTLLTHSDKIENFWELETLGITDPVENQSRKEMEEIMMNHFKKTLKINEEGRYEVKLPWIDHSDLPDNRKIAEKRLYSTTSKLLAGDKFEDYNAVFEEWEKETIIEQVPEEEINSQCHYLPHRGVFKTAATTKVRPVFDASCKEKGFYSLNDCLEKGPNFLDTIPSILLRFREKEIGIISDIEKAFLQISVDKEDRNFLRFLWWSNYERREMKIFRHRRVVFGVNCSPFLLGAVINHHLENYLTEFSDIAGKLKHSFYVDNCVTSVNTREEMEHFIDGATQLRNFVKFNLRGWECTCFDDYNVQPANVLGLLWDRNEDVIYCNLSDIETTCENVTRRKVLSIIQKIFDPIGYTCPVTIIPKSFLQESWRSKLSWDEKMPASLEKKFLKWMKDVSQLADVKIPRCVLPSKYRMSYSTHIFCDASERNYAAVVYLRAQGSDDVYVQLLQAKSRVSPLKKVTMPRLELLACYIGARLCNSVLQALSTSSVYSSNSTPKTYFWTDSTTVLSWIQKQQPWRPFVQNRVQEILRLSNPRDWWHVPGEMNPADLPSRGCSVETLKASRWWEGPVWLKEDQNEWPNFEYEANEEVVNQEKKKSVMTSLANPSESEYSYIERFSSYTKIKRITAWILRFLNNVNRSKQKISEINLTVEELSCAEKKLVKLIQNESFHSEGSDKLKSLSVVEDDDGLLRVKTKLLKREDKENFKMPLVLPSSHRLVKLLIEEEHLRMSHAGLHTLLSSLRENFWILRGRKTVRSVISKCIRCRRFAANKINVSPGTLPEDRVKDGAAFEVTGVDLAGPLILRSKEKAWILLFTCAIYRAVHLELIMSLSTNGFLLGFRRFIARRGRPKIMYSDNGTNFVGTNNLFLSIDWNKIQEKASVWQIQWKFNPPTAAWWGGWWERLVQITKGLLRRILGKSSLNYEELVSVLCDCEAVINSRPITYLSENPDDLIPITPAMFIQEITSVGVPDLDHLDEINLSKRFRYQQQLREQLRKRFRNEYLGLLIERPGKGKFHPVNVGDIVLLGSDGVKRLNWPLGQVLETIPGRDGITRLVRVKTLNGQLLRPVQRLYPLEISSKERLENSVVKSARSEKSDVLSRTCKLSPEPTRDCIELKNVVHKQTKSGRTVRAPKRLNL